MKILSVKSISKPIGIFTAFTITLFLANAMAQTPQGLPQPHENEPINFNYLPNVILFIVIPILIFLVYFILKRRQKRRKEGEQKGKYK